MCILIVGPPIKQEYARVPFLGDQLAGLVSPNRRSKALSGWSLSRCRIVCRLLLSGCRWDGEYCVLVGGSLAG